MVYEFEIWMLSKCFNDDAEVNDWSHENEGMGLA